MLEDTPDDPDIPYLIAGNYSELVTEQVEYILDHNPELEAIAFAMIIWQRQDTASVLQETFWWDMTLTMQKPWNHH